MDIYHAWCDLKPGVGDVAFAEGVAGYMGHLKQHGLIERRGESLDAGLDRLARAACAGPQEPRPLCDHILAASLESPAQRWDDVTAVVARLTAIGGAA